MPQVDSTGPHDPNNSSPGNAYNSGGGGGATTLHFDFNLSQPKDQVFECIGRGLKPNTIHKFYYENVDRTEDCRQLGSSAASTGIKGKLGGPLITDESGYVRFNFHFTAAVEKEVDALNKVNYNLIGDKLFELRAVDSTAKKIVPFSVDKTSAPSSPPKKTAPTQPRPPIR